MSFKNDSMKQTQKIILMRKTQKQKNAALYTKSSIIEQVTSKNVFGCYQALNWAYKII